jgi:hypothetical protein
MVFDPCSAPFPHFQMVPYLGFAFQLGRRQGVRAVPTRGVMVWCGRENKYLADEITSDDVFAYEATR